MNNSLSSDTIQRIKAAANIDERARIAQRTVVKNGLKHSAESVFLSAANTSTFSHELETGKANDQKNSGRCWLFGALNFIAYGINAKYKFEDFELSQNYNFFWDKFERSNLFYANVLKTSDKSRDDRLLQDIFMFPQEDGGFWEGAVSLIQKYGVVPQSVMPETHVTGDTTALNNFLNRKLRKDGLRLRRLLHDKANSEDIISIKEAMLAENYRILAIAFGTPPETFDFAIKDKDKKLHRETSITPLEFAKKYITIDFENYIQIANDELPSRSFNTFYKLEDTEHVAGGMRAQFLSVDHNDFIKILTAQIVDKEPAWFGCDVNTDMTKNGYLAINAHNYAELFNIDVSIPKADRMEVFDILFQHAVLITGVDIVNDKPRQWKVRNSWGEEVGNKGYYTMSTEWLKQNGLAFVANKKHLSTKQLAALNKKPEIISRWDGIY